MKNCVVCDGSFMGNEIEDGVFHGGELEGGTFHHFYPEAVESKEGNDAVSVDGDHKSRSEVTCEVDSES